MKLRDFSIINGCQTVTLIGEYKGSNEGEDFLLPCKIVKPKDEKQFSSFISEIAEASNSQKPISDRDLKANRKEQRNLQNELRKQEPKIYLEIKRGENYLTPAKKRALKDWQFVKNDLYGQLILAFHFQSPCTARAHRAKIFADTSVYDKIFKRHIDKESTVDLLKLYSFYQAFLNFKAEKEPFSDPNFESVASNGPLIILGLVGFFIKVSKQLVDKSKIGNQEDWELEVTADNLKGRILSDLPDEELESRLYGFFNEMVNEIYGIYEPRIKEEKTVSNFFKSDDKYRNIILKRIIERYFLKGAPRQGDLPGYLKIFA